MEDQIKKGLIEAVNRDIERRKPEYRYCLKKWISLYVKAKDPYKPLAEIMNAIHEQGVENEVFELLAQWMVEDRYNKMKKLAEDEGVLHAINKIAKESKDTKQAMVDIISLSERGDDK